ncbi:hypothetical protein NYE54_05605 [Paenibacillus sp. FSL K6-1330]|uniref:hypothetical protein n=1 Tax=Paenibacillus sp. FSL K6-1330 TaxID=2975292 RepID=UPI0030D71997
MSEVREYWDNTILTLNEAYTMRKVQHEIFKAARDRLSQDQFKANLDKVGAASAVYGLFGTSSVALLAAGVLGIIAGGWTNEYVKVTAEEGYVGLGDIEYWMRDHPTYDAVDYEIAWLEYTVTTSYGRQIVRYPQRVGKCLRARRNGVWISQS